MQNRPAILRDNIEENELVYATDLTISGKINKAARIILVANATVLIQPDTIIDETVKFEVRMNASLKFSSRPSDKILENIKQSALGQISFPVNGVILFYKTALLKARNYPFVNNAGTNSHLVAAPVLTSPTPSM